LQILENIETAEKQREQSEKNLKEFDEIIVKSRNKAKEVMLVAREKVFSEITKKKIRNLLQYPSKF
jgi:F-type H+-transporting ATPase subunit b